MPARTFVRKFDRMTDQQGRTLFFVSRSGSRRRRSLFLDPGQFPAFDGESGWFELEHDGKGGWLVKRQVERPQGL
jgi:hypothetical protein